MSFQLKEKVLTCSQNGLIYVLDFTNNDYVGVQVEVVDHTDVHLGSLDCYCVLDEQPLTIQFCNCNGHDETSVTDLVDVEGTMKQLLLDGGLYQALLAYRDTSTH